ncbi:lactococcin 972 family bacteriocin [Streptomyces sp. NPDC048604]|uniref:lactococcin 972 family bacteriocin n=1 Tax=Streptomyces sp. NPDC048604 TaxID=3365578 RepID=UPI0037106885
MKMIAKLGVATGALVMAAATPALATIEYPSAGGTWDYGTNSSIVWSDYYHGGRCHGSTSVGSYTDRSPNTSAGYWSITSAPERDGVADKSYYRVC